MKAHLEIITPTMGTLSTSNVDVASKTDDVVETLRDFVRKAVKGEMEYLTIDKDNIEYIIPNEVVQRSVFKIVFTK